MKKAYWLYQCTLLPGSAWNIPGPCSKIRLVEIKAGLACCNILLKVTNLSAGLYISQAGSSLKALLNRIPKLCLLLLLLDSYEGSLGLPVAVEKVKVRKCPADVYYLLYCKLIC